MSDPNSAKTAQLLGFAIQGQDDAREELLAVVYEELRRLAAGYLSRERVDHTLQPTALVHEAYLRLFGGVFSYPTAAPWTMLFKSARLRP